MKLTPQKPAQIRYGETTLEEERAEQRQEAGQGERGQLLANIRRLTTIVLDKLEQGSKEGTLDQAQIRLLGSIVMRSLGLWQETLNPRPRRRPRRELQDTEDQLPDKELDRKREQG